MHFLSVTCHCSLKIWQDIHIIQQNTVFNAAFSFVMCEECSICCKVPENFTMISPDPPSPPKLMQMHNMTDREAISCPISDQQPKGEVGAAVRQGDFCNYAAFPWLTTRWQDQVVKMDQQFSNISRRQSSTCGWRPEPLLKDKMIEYVDSRKQRNKD